MTGSYASTEQQCCAGVVTLCQDCGRCLLLTITVVTLRLHDRPYVQIKRPYDQIDPASVRMYVPTYLLCTLFHTYNHMHQA